MVMESKVDLPCSICGNMDGMSMLSISSEIPYFGEHTQITLICENCGWRHTDFIPTEGKKPGFWSLFIDSPEKLSARIVRSSSCTIRIPQLDIEVVPGSSSTGFISNVEGVIGRFEQAVNTVIRSEKHSQGDSDNLERATSILDSLSVARLGESSISIELLDPRGSSQIIHDSVNSRQLTDDELSILITGPELPVFEL